MPARREPPLPIYRLVGGRLVPGVSRGGSVGVVDVREDTYLLPGIEDEKDAIRVHTQRRAIHGGSRVRGSPLVTGPLHLIRYDAALAVILSANQDRLAELRTRNSQVMRQRTEELDATARRLGEDASAWRRARLAIDREPVDAIELGWEGWWIVLHIGLGKVADVWVCGPPGTRPEPLAVETR